MRTLQKIVFRDAPGWLADFYGNSAASSYYWNGSDLSGSFTSVLPSGSATWTEGDNLLTALATNQTAEDWACQLAAHSFSVGDAFVLPVRLPLLYSDSGNDSNATRAMGIVFSDGTSTSSNCVMGHLQWPNDNETQALLVGRHGTIDAVSTAPWVSMSQDGAGGGWIYIKLIYQASNTFRLQFSPDGRVWSAFGESDISKTMTPTHVGVGAYNANTSGTAIMTCGPLRKVA